MISLDEQGLERVCEKAASWALKKAERRLVYELLDGPLFGPETCFETCPETHPEIRPEWQAKPRVLKLFPDRFGRPMATLELCPDGSINYREKRPRDIYNKEPFWRRKRRPEEWAERWLEDGLEVDICLDTHPWLAHTGNARQLVRIKVWKLVLDGQKGIRLAGYTDAVLVDILANQRALLWDIRAVIDEVTGELFRDALTPYGPEFLALDQAYRKVVEVVYGMMDPGVLAMIDRLYGGMPGEKAEMPRHSPLLSEYNLVARNRGVFGRMLDEAPGILRFYCLFVAPGMDCIGHGSGRENGHESGGKIGDKIRVKIGDKIATARVFEHPREVTGIVKAALGLGPGQWRYFTRLWEELERSPKSGVEYREPLLKNIRLWTRFLADVNRPEAGCGAFLKAAKLDHEYYSRAHWRHGDPWRAWVHLGNQFLAAGPGANAVRWMEFNDTADALRWHIEHEQPWGPAGWTVYMNRSARWHQEMTVAGDQEARARYENARWESLLGEVDLGDPAHGGLKAVPVTEGVVLCDLAREMGNCLASYVPRCVEGGTRIFAFYTVEGKELEEDAQEDAQSGEARVGENRAAVGPGQREPRLRLSGAGELRREGRHSREATWRVGQVEGSRGSRASSPEVVRAMDEIGKLYQAAQAGKGQGSSL